MLSYNSKNGSISWAIAFAAVGAALTFSSVYLLAPPNSYIYSLFFERSWIQPITTFAFWLTVLLLLFKYRRSHKEREAFRNVQDLFESGEFSTTRIWADAPRVLSQVSGKEYEQYQSSLIFTRIRNGLDRLRKTQSTGKMEDYFRNRSEVDAVELESGYAAIRYLIWLIPTLGFIGTIMGIGRGIAGFSEIIQSAGSFSDVRIYLPVVTSDLGTAFDTTLLALAFSAIAALLLSFILRQEESLLDQIDSFSFDTVCALFQEHSTASESIIRAISENVETIKTSMNGNRGSIEQVIRDELPSRLVTELVAQLKPLVEKLVDAKSADKKRGSGASDGVTRL